MTTIVTTSVARKRRITSASPKIAYGSKLPMIKSIHIKNFRGFKNFALKGCTGINVIVGDNGVGKTALLEAMYLTLSMSTQNPIALRQWRGFDSQFAGAPSAIVDGIYADLFPQLDMRASPEIRLLGNGPEVRSLTISRAHGYRLPKKAKAIEQAEVDLLVFEWTNQKGHKLRAPVSVGPNGINFGATGEAVPSSFLFSSQVAISSQETAQRFSELRKSRVDQNFIEVFTQVFDWIEDISVESYGGLPVLHAAVRNQKALIPLPVVSGAVNRFAAILLSIAHRRRGCVMVDEIENGMFYDKQPLLLKALLKFAREYECQLFITTHSQEWLRAFVRAAGDDVDDIALWRFARRDKGTDVQRFDGLTLKSGVEYGVEIRRELGADEDAAAASSM